MQAKKQKNKKKTAARRPWLRWTTEPVAATKTTTTTIKTTKNSLQAFGVLLPASVAIIAALGVAVATAVGCGWSYAIVFAISSLLIAFTNCWRMRQISFSYFFMRLWVCFVWLAPKTVGRSRRYFCKVHFDFAVKKIIFFCFYGFIVFAIVYLQRFS